MTRREELYETARDLYDGNWRAEDKEELAAALADWRKEARKRGDEIDETYTVEEEAEIICGYLHEEHEMKNTTRRVEIVRTAARLWKAGRLDGHHMGRINAWLDGAEEQEMWDIITDPFVPLYFPEKLAKVNH